MTVKNPRPFPENGTRANGVNERRNFAAKYSVNYPSVDSKSNDEEMFHANEKYPTNFTKGLRHNEYGHLDDAEHYSDLVKEINQQDATDFESVQPGIGPIIDNPGTEHQALTTKLLDGEKPEWRGWESPRAGHYYDLQGPDADAVGMPPAPLLGSKELIAEMGEVYALALLRDIPFSQIVDGSGEDESTGISASVVLAELAQLDWYTDNTDSGLSLQEQRRKAARRVDHGANFAIDNPPVEVPFSQQHVFRGSGPSVKVGPYVSQFMLVGNEMKAKADEPGLFDDSTISYGAQIIDQKIGVFPAHIDHLLHWNAYLDVQNGADLGYANQRQTPRRFITTPRDLATYVRYDQLYQAYLNACIFMLESGEFKFQQPVMHPYTEQEGPGFPDRDSSKARQAFAAFGGPHILSLVTEVATRCLKAVRRQKFNYHRRARPERIGALLTVASSTDADAIASLGPITTAKLNTMLTDLQPLLDLVNIHNNSRLADADAHLDKSESAGLFPQPDWFENGDNYLLPMAFAEGSPMHPSYGAGHATVAGGCVTMLKAFFATVNENGEPILWPEEVPIVQATPDGMALEDLRSAETVGVDGEALTIAGELNKLAANISVARDMAGVHYYTDYYESLRMGERIATGILLEQMKHYNEPVELDFHTFDGDHLHIVKNDYDYSEPRIFIHDSVDPDKLIAFEDWWVRHMDITTHPVPVFA